MVTFMKIKGACQETGLSQKFLRDGCKNGTIPHVKSGSVYYIDIERLLEKLRAELGVASLEAQAVLIDPKDKPSKENEEKLRAFCAALA